MSDPRIKAVVDGLAAGKITLDEAQFYLKQECGITLEEAIAGEQASAPRASERQDTPHFTKGRLAVYALLVIIAASLFTYLSPGITGFIVLDHTQENNTITIGQEIIGLNVSGTLTGEGAAEVYFDTPNGTYHVASVTSDPGLPRTDKPGYGIGDPISIEHAPEGATYYFDDGTSSTPVDLPLSASADGTLLIVTPSETYRLPVIIGDAQRTTAFTQCIETCTLPATNGTIRIEASGNASVNITRVDATIQQPNRAPQQAVALGPLTVTGTTSIDLDPYFIDPDGDTLLYSASSDATVGTAIDGSTLTLTPLSAGATTLTIYVSDLQELVPFTIDVQSMPANGMANTTEGNSTNEPIPPADPPATPPTDGNATSNTTNSTLDCSGTNPNTLPEECLLQNAGEYFPEQDIYWQDLDRQDVARFTVIGNLLLTGNIVEHSTGAPGPRDFRIGHEDRDGNQVSTIWIDSSGNLHLKGSLHEENANLLPSPGTYSIITKRSVYLAYADVETGELYLRGNAIPYRRSLG